VCKLNLSHTNEGRATLGLEGTGNLNRLTREVSRPDVVGGFDTVGAYYIGRDRIHRDEIRDNVAQVAETEGAHDGLEIGQCLRNAECVGSGAAEIRVI
jgi:hypothetical protein